MVGGSQQLCPRDIGWVNNSYVLGGCVISIGYVGRPMGHYYRMCWRVSGPSMTCLREGGWATIVVSVGGSLGHYFRMCWRAVGPLLSYELEGRRVIIAVCVGGSLCHYCCLCWSVGFPTFPVYPSSHPQGKVKLKLLYNTKIHSNPDEVTIKKGLQTMEPST